MGDRMVAHLNAAVILADRLDPLDFLGGLVRGAPHDDGWSARPPGLRPLSLKAIFMPPLGNSWDFERHIPTSTRFASSLRSRVALARQRRTNTVATRKTDEKADQQQQRCKSHDDPAPRSAAVTY